MTQVKTRQRLGDRLIEKGILNADQLRIALTEQASSGEPLGKVIVRLGLAAEAQVRDAIGETLSQESVDLTRIVVDSEALELISKDVSRRFKVLPLEYNRATRTLTLAMASTFDVVALNQIRAYLPAGTHVKTLLAGETEIENAISQFYRFTLTIDGILSEMETGEVDKESLETESDEFSHPIVRLVDAFLSDAVKMDVSDIHFEPDRGLVRVRYRIDGMLRQVRSLHIRHWSAIAVRLKVMSRMNIAETRAPQDGRFSVTLLGRAIDFRVSSQPTTWGENFVLRILDRERGIVPLEELGLYDDTIHTFTLMMARPEGVILVTGPTGSGKTTTLYSMLNHINSETVNIMTLEDPVEYPLALVRQTSINEAAGVTFASGIRSLMRQDPDIILVGEIRDKDTADMTLRAAMTGHQVYSTLHSNSAIGAIPRLLDLGVAPFLLSDNIIGIVAQRLVRRLCTSCRETYAPGLTERELLGLPVDCETLLYQAQGCEECDQIGYKGRIALLEVLTIDDGVDDLIARSAPVTEIRHYAAQVGFKTLADDGVRRVLDGTTSLDEVTRVVNLTDRLAQVERAHADSEQAVPLAISDTAQAS